MTGGPARWWLLLAVAFFMVGCAAPRPPATASNSWTGRLAIQVEGQPSQSFSAGFDLSGSPETGELALTSPLGNTLATVRWSPGSAELVQGDTITRRGTLDELTSEFGGTRLPVVALFAWLSGQAMNAHGWQADLSQHAEGRISARRTDPAPAAQLRLVFQP